MSRPALKAALGAGVRFFGFALVVLPLAAASYATIEWRWMPPADPARPAIVLAAALVLLVAARLGLRALGTTSHRGQRALGAVGSPAPDRPPRARPPVLASAVRDAHGPGPSRSSTSAVRGESREDRDGGEAPGAAASAPSPPGTAAAPAPDAGQEGLLLLDALRSCMDDVSYAPGNPNVLSMTKYLHAPEGGRPDTGGPLPLAAGAAESMVSRTDDGETTVLAIGGVLDAATVGAVRGSTEALVAERRKHVVLDLSSLQRVDSAGVGLIVGLFKRSRSFGGVVSVSGLKDQPLQIFRLLRLDRVFPLP